MAKFRLLLVALTLIAVFATSLLVARPAHAQTLQSQSVATRSVQLLPQLCRNSTGFIAWWGYGIHVSHCDLQSIRTQSDAWTVISTAAGIYRPGLGLLAAGLWWYLGYLLNNDHGNGVYIAAPFAGTGIWVWSA
jgi:hypothetical protein